MRLPAADWQGRVDKAEGPAARRWHQIVRPRGERIAPVALLGFACDAGVVRNGGRAGAAEGPGALRGALANVAAHAVEAVDDLGDVTCEGDALEVAQSEYAALAAKAIATPGRLLIGLGGGHEIAWASWCGLRDALDAHGDNQPVGIVNFDAHLDLRGDERGNSGTPFRQILEDAAAHNRRLEYRCLGVNRFANTAALFERARRLGVTWIEDSEVRADRWEALAAELEAFLAGVGHVYLSVCLDVLPAASAPGVSAPAALGVDVAMIERLTGFVASSGLVRVADVAELNPHFDVDGRTARVAARLVANIVERAVAS